jgi:hypothetical protein
MSVLGERFLLFRPVTLNRVAVTTKALNASGSEATMRKELSSAMHGFLANRKADRTPTIDTDTIERLAVAADIVTRARSGVVRDGCKRDLEYAPEPEVPTRFAKVMLALARGIALAYDGDVVTEREIRLVFRVALDCLSIIRRQVIAALVQGAIDDEDGTLATSAIAGAAQFST